MFPSFNPHSIPGLTGGATNTGNRVIIGVTRHSEGQLGGAAAHAEGKLRNPLPNKVKIHDGDKFERKAGGGCGSTYSRSDPCGHS